MKRLARVAALMALAGLSALAQARKTWTVPEVLAALTRAAPDIRAVSADAAVVDYTALIQQSAHSAGKLYFERSRQGPRYVLDLNQPAATAKKLVYTDHTAWVYTPSAKQVVKYALGADPLALNQYLLLGMGASGAELTQAFLVTLDGATELDGKAAVELTLTPRAAHVKDKFTSIDIWYDPHTWIGVQQKIWQPGGDYHLLMLSQVELNPRLSNKLFSTSFPGATVITPHF
ncbi:MAG: LolA family protein [Terriglobales bacterium]